MFTPARALSDEWADKVTAALTRAMQKGDTATASFIRGQMVKLEVLRDK